MLSDFLLRYRLEHGLSQEDLARKLSLSQNTISQYESGKRNPRAKRLVYIADTLDVDVESIIHKVGN